MQESHSFDFEKIKHGVMLILFGAMKKYAIADLLYSRVTDVLDSSNIQMPGVIIAAGILMYAVYQYADFSGGIDMVLGIAEMAMRQVCTVLRAMLFRWTTTICLLRLQSRIQMPASVMRA